MRFLLRILHTVLMLIAWAALPLIANQGKEIRGILVTVTYDTLEGFLKRVPEKKLYENIKFRQTAETDYAIYRPEQIEAFISEEISLVSYKVNLNNVDRYIIIRKLYEGSRDLYYSRAENQSDIFTDSHDLYFAGFEDGRIIQMQKRYLVRTLNAIFCDCECVLNRIENDRFDYYYYRSSKLIELFETYNECSNPALALKSRARKTRYFDP